MKLLKRINAVVDKFSEYFFIFYILTFLILILLIIFLSIKESLNYIGLNNFFGISSIVLFSLMVIGFMVFLLKKTKNEGKFKRNFLRIFNRKWLIFFLVLVLMFLSFIPNILKVYPGQPDLGRSYEGWFINNGYSGIPENFSNVKIDSRESRYFVKNIRIQMSFSFTNSTYKTITVKGIQKNKNNTLLYESIYYCQDFICKIENMQLNPNTERIELIPGMVEIGNYTHFEEPAIFILHPDIIEEKEVKEKEREKMLFLGSLISIILLTTAGFVNQLRQIWNNKK